MKKINKFIISIGIILPLLFVSCMKNTNNDESSVEPSRFLFLSSVFYMDIRDDRDDKDAITDEVHKRLEEIENRLSLHLPSSDISKVNNLAGKEKLKVSEDVINCIKESMKLKNVTEDNDAGSYNVKIGPLSTLWNIGSSSEKVPRDEEIKNALELVNQDMEIDYNNREVFLKKEGMKLDLGASAKGYATDEIVKILKKHDVKNAIIDLGGNVYVLGDNDGKSFKVGVQNPLSERGEYLGIVKCSNKAIVTSGIYERFFEENGKRYHHILSDKTGYPVDNEIISISVISDNGMDADILSTSFYLLGLEKGLKKANEMKDISCIFLTKDNKIYLTDNIKDNFELTDESFKIN